ncbi:MAG: M42 family metallopeptidase [Candidatus Coatesbacteria bacterium]|nr:M42 family metallopeptidase [Candidatus Coatesbacteria bacterium]
MTTASDPLVELLRSLVNTFGISGHESRVATIFEDNLKNLCEISADKLGCSIARSQGSSNTPKIMVTAHMDEIGFFVKEVTKEGFIKFLPIGGWWGHIALGMEVVVYSRFGEFPGIVGSTPPHILEPDKRKNVIPLNEMYIDVGGTYDFDIIEKMGIRPGDPIVPVGEFKTMGNPNLFMGKAWDDRVGVAELIQIMRKVAKIAHSSTVFGVGTVQEEVGLRGARSSVFQIKPDIAFALDVTIAKDTPGTTRGAVGDRLGDGAAVLVYDSTMIPNQKLLEFVVKVAEEEDIPFYLTSLTGGYDTGNIHMEFGGIPSIVIATPARYIHSNTGIVHRKDIESVVRLLVSVIERLNRKQVRMFSK